MQPNDGTDSGNLGGIMTKETGLELLRKPFPENLINKLPKPTCKADIYKKLPKAICKICGGYHATSKTIHLNYVGHAALTDRLLDSDPQWNWVPLTTDEHGLPLFDKTGGLWIELTVCGVTRLGYGNAKPNPYAEVGSREKEVIGDALRNAAMRFGAALDLWHKGDLHIDNDDDDLPKNDPPPKKTYPDYVELVDKLATADAVLNWKKDNETEIRNNLVPADIIKLGSYCNQIIDVFTAATDKENKLNIAI